MPESAHFATNLGLPDSIASDLMLPENPTIADYVFAKLNARDPDLVADWIAEYNALWRWVTIRSADG